MDDAQRDRERIRWNLGRIKVLDQLFSEAIHFEFKGLPIRARHALIGCGYYYRAQVSRATDDELLSCRGLGERSLAAIRSLMPHEKEPADGR